MTFLDWAIIALCFAFAGAIGVAMSRRAGSSLSEHFLGGRSLPWWLDVISMGGMLRKLAENENRVTVAYQTSGNIAVFDHEVRRYLDFSQRAS
ncbi:MAG: hypothetical protein HN750_13625, partial [Gemmatimonadales bacterium]|nr:hypothetical protein [Gemmatimonadales bacterium]MBT7693031.1 hypothetical protein [Gemmatimonadales bacterium]